jgi:putative pyruvate formate lyase activating enzyme
MKQVYAPCGSLRTFGCETFKFGPGRCAMTLAKTPWYWETVTRNIALLDEWGEDFSTRHLVMPNHVECCTCPVLEWIADHMPAAPVNVMAQFRPDNFCDSASVKYRDKYAEIVRRPTHGELDRALVSRTRIGSRI